MLHAYHTSYLFHPGLSASHSSFFFLNFTAKPKVDIRHEPDLWCVGRVSCAPHPCLFGKHIYGHDQTTCPGVKYQRASIFIPPYLWVYNNMLSTYLPFIKLSVVHSPLKYNVRAVAEQHCCAKCCERATCAAEVWEYNKIHNMLWTTAAPLRFAHPRALLVLLQLCYNGDWWELLKKGCDIILYCMGREMGGWHLIRKHGRGGRRSEKRKRKKNDHRIEEWLVVPRPRIRRLHYHSSLTIT